MKKDPDKFFFCILSLLIFCFILIRAFSIPLFVDELATYNFYVKNQFFSPFNPYSKANNHLVNTFLTFVSFSSFGNSPFALRIPNLLAFIPFAIYLYKFGLFFKHRIAKWAFYISFLFTLNFLAYFAVSRGYGLGYCFILIGIYYCYKTFNHNKISHVFFTVLFTTLALYANFSLLLISLIIGGILLINVFKNKDYYFSKRIILALLLSIIIYITAIYFSIIVLLFYKENGLLWWGDLNGFWEDTMNSLIHHLFNIEYPFYFISTFIILSSILILLITIKQLKYKAENLFFFLLFFNVLGIILMANLLKVNYPFQRTGSHLYFLFLGAFCLTIDKFSNYKYRAAILTPILLIPFHFVLYFNINHFVDWEEDNLPEMFFSKIEELESKKVQTYFPTIYIEGTQKECWNYYDFNYLGNILMPHVIYNKETDKLYYDYLIDRKENAINYIQYFDSIYAQNTSEICLFKRKKDPTRFFLTENIIETPISSKKTYYPFIEINIDSNKYSHLNIELTIDIQSSSLPFQSSIIFTADDLSSNEQYDYKSFPLDVMGKLVKGKKIKVGSILNGLPIGKKMRIIVYLWNKKNGAYKINYSKAKINFLTD